MSEHGAIPDEPSIFDDDEEATGHGVVRIASVAALGGLLFGYDSAVINGAVSAIEDNYDIHGQALGFAVAAVLLGAAAGAMSAGRFADRFGRLFVMKVASVLFLISAFGAGLVDNLWLFILFRVIGGAGVGIASVIAPAYIAEISPARIRGRLGSLQQLAIVSGIFLSLLIDFLLAQAAGGSKEELWLGLEAWRWMFIVMAVPAVAYGLLALTIPESPRYLVARHKIPEARKVLTALLGERNLEIKINRIRETLKREKPPSWGDLRAPGGTFLLPIVWVGVLLSVFQQAVGINVIFYYSNVLWEAVGFSEDGSFVITVITSIVNVATTIIAIALVDKIGRKPLLLIGSAGMTVTLATMAIIFQTASLDADGKPELTGVTGPIALIAANLFVVAFGMSWGPVVWVLLGEMFPNRIRAAALSLAAAAQWVANWVITVSFPELKDISLGLAYGIYGVSALLSFLFVMRFVRETKGVTLEDMHDDLAPLPTPPAVPH
ncbi:sugar porter family MFS transporter [Antrihabitans sp. YC2-6]|uniref:sugar porter family MFS transporter n=1 Tax=Antrihabitans sp. YC2-6 TaxID=2799498 RepID=UPI0018F4F605|nr:sugar porter family MFS transporter [Antrihabitans sp. YC2-6]MBJ8344146.1 sugar porter family MFS transporter [Antrihabitans sp. YC2-6]